MDNLNLSEFVKLSNVISFSNIALVIAYYNEKHNRKDWFLTSELRESFVEARIQPPVNLNDVILKAQKKGYLLVNKTKVLFRYKLSQSGVDFVEAQLEIAGLLSSQTNEENRLLKGISESLHNNLSSINNSDERGYIQEALTCLDPHIKAYRASILMGWSGTIYHLRKKVEAVGFDKFCQTYESLSLGKVKKISTIDDLEYYQEKDFLLVIEKLGIIDKAVRQQLEHCLDLRNACRHPTQVSPQVHKVKSFFEDIIQYVLSK